MATGGGLETRVPSRSPYPPPLTKLVSHSIDKGFVDLHYWKGE